MTDITMSVDETLEVDAVVEEWSNPDSTLDFNGDKSSFDLSGIQTKTSIINPQQPGTYTITVNGQELSVEVIGTDAIPDSGGTHQWNFDESNGTTATDDIGSLDGTLNGPSWVSGQGIGDFYLDFDGSGDFIDLGLASASELNHFTNDGKGTFGVWINPDSASNTAIVLGGRFGNNERHLVIAVNNGGMTARMDDGGSTVFSISGGSLPTNEWRFVGVTLDGSTASLYVEDSSGAVSQVNSTSFSIGNPGDWTRNAIIGGNKAQDKRYFNGGMGVPFVDNIADSQSELQTWRDDTASFFA